VKLERIEDPQSAPDAPEPSLDQLHECTSKNFKVEIDRLNTTILAVELPSYRMKLKRVVGYEYSKEKKFTQAIFCVENGLL